MDTQALVVIGAGFGRTGTASLKAALEIILGKPCYHMSEVVEKHPEHIAEWLDLYKLVEHDPEAELPRKKIKSMFKGYCTAVDHPASTVYKQLMKIYPNAKIILTIRDKTRWLESVRETILPKKSNLLQKIIPSLMMDYHIGRGFAKLIETTFQLNMGSDVDLNNDEQMLIGFERWNNQVQTTVPAEKLLVYEIKQGWLPLCEFLNVPVPDMPFPHINDRIEFKERIANDKLRITLWFTICISGILIGYVAYSRYAI